MEVANTQTTMPLADLVLVAPETSGGASNPAAVYLAGLARTGRRAMMGQLKWVAAVVVRAESVESVPWHRSLSMPWNSSHFVPADYSINRLAAL